MTVAIRRHSDFRHRGAIDELKAAPADSTTGPIDHVPAAEVLEHLAIVPGWSSWGNSSRSFMKQGASAILDWLSTHPGEGWQARWDSSGLNSVTDPADLLMNGVAGTNKTKKRMLIAGMTGLLVSQLARPSYDYLQNRGGGLGKLLDFALEARRPGTRLALEKAAAEYGLGLHSKQKGIVLLGKVVLHTGREIDQLTINDLHTYRSWNYRRWQKFGTGSHAACDLLRNLGIIPLDITMKESLHRGQMTTTEHVDQCGVQSRAIREVLIRYLDERRASLDYVTFRKLAATLSKVFWADIERHHPEQETLRLPRHVIAGWKERLAVVTMPKGTTRPRQGVPEVLIAVRAFYLDISEWAIDDPFWAVWAAPSPVRVNETTGFRKTKHARQAAIHQRIRERMPLLATLVAHTEQHLAEQQTFLKAATSVVPGEKFAFGGQTFDRVKLRDGGGTLILAKNVDTAERVDVGAAERQAFWTWACIEVLRHTGVRIEELLEITHLALVTYRLPETGEVVPLLQIVPSKTDEERLLLVTPELAHVLAAIVKRHRDENGGSIPLVARYDRHERKTGPELPHLFQYRLGWRPTVLSGGVVQKFLTAAVARTGLSVRYTPHDFRRLFTTDAVTGGLPVHIAARILGHRNLGTTQGYLAVFQDDLIRAYRSHVLNRRGLRPAAEYREPTDDEWQEFQKHFELRKVELGTCGRPYATPCQHEHSCVRCPMLRVEPRQRPRLVEIVDNLSARVKEARINGWLGEVEGLNISLDAAVVKLNSLDRRTQTQLGIPQRRP